MQIKFDDIVVIMLPSDRAVRLYCTSIWCMFQTFHLLHSTGPQSRTVGQLRWASLPFVSCALN